MTNFLVATTNYITAGSAPEVVLAEAATRLAFVHDTFMSRSLYARLNQATAELRSMVSTLDGLIAVPESLDDPLASITEMRERARNVLERCNTAYLGEFDRVYDSIMQVVRLWTASGDAEMGQRLLVQQCQNLFEIIRNA